MKQPMQPIYIDHQDVTRFKNNGVVQWIIDSKKLSLNDIDTEAFPAEDVAQFWQMLGYSTSGYGGLSFIPEAIVAEADAKAAELIQARKASK
jgi:hypothetical protein